MKNTITLPTKTQVTKEERRAFFDAWREVYKRSDLSRAELALMLELRDTSYPEYWFSYKSIGEKIGVSRRQAIRVVQGLKDKGLINYQFSPRTEDQKNERVYLELIGLRGSRKVRGHLGEITSDMDDTTLVTPMTLPASDMDVTQMNINQNEVLKNDFANAQKTHEEHTSFEEEGNISPPELALSLNYRTYSPTEEELKEMRSKFPLLRDEAIKERLEAVKSYLEAKGFKQIKHERLIGYWKTFLHNMKPSKRETVFVEV